MDKLIIKIIEILIGNPLTVTLVLAGVFCVIIAIIGEIPKTQGRISGIRAVALGVFGFLLISIAVGLAWVSAISSQTSQPQEVSQQPTVQTEPTLTETAASGPLPTLSPTKVIQQPSPTQPAGIIPQVTAEQGQSTPVCFLDLRADIPGIVVCNGGGKLSIRASGEDATTPWNGRLSRVVVPLGWKVVLYYETWIAPSYSERDPSKEGFVSLEPGEVLLQNPGFPVYGDSDLTELIKTCEANELNDKIQYLIIFPGSGELVLSEGTFSPYGKELFIVYQPDS